MGALAPGSHMDFPIDVLTRIIRPSAAGSRPATDLAGNDNPEPRVTL